MKKLTLVWLVVVLLAFAGCGRSQESLLNMFEVSKCDTVVYIDGAKVAHFNDITPEFEKFCRFTMGTDPSGNPIQVFQNWNYGWRKIKNPACGFWTLDNGALVTYDNKELDLSNSPDIAACPSQ